MQKLIEDPSKKTMGDQGMGCRCPVQMLPTSTVISGRTLDEPGPKSVTIYTNKYFNTKNKVSAKEKNIPAEAFGGNVNKPLKKYQVELISGFEQTTTMCGGLCFLFRKKMAYTNKILRLTVNLWRERFQWTTKSSTNNMVKMLI